MLDLVAGALPDPAAAIAHDHLDRCDECRALVAGVIRGGGAAGDDTDGHEPVNAAGTPGADGEDARDDDGVDGRGLDGGEVSDGAILAVERVDAGAGAEGACDGGDRGGGWQFIARGSQPTAPTEPLRPGDLSGVTLADRPIARRAPRPPPVERVEEYELIDLLGRGGMGTVFRAHDTLLDREVALKLIARTSSERARQRFLVEARAVARIRHPNVVVVHRVGVADDQPYIVYALVRGRTFEDIRKPMPWPKLLELAVGVVRGLAAAHACSVLHRDIKPANLMLDEHGEVVLVDFGLAKLEGEDVPGEPASPARPLADAPITVTGVALGTPRYMAPEAWRGAAATPQTDLYSFGVVLYELLAGRPPFTETSVDELARRVCQEDAPSITELAPWVPPLLAAVVDRCVAREPARRPASAATLGDELEALQRGRAFDAFERDRINRTPLGNPYPGERPFGFEHQGVFFGRRDELRELVDLLRTRPFVVVAGAAGAGKTSLCLAGLLPIVARGALGGSRKWVPIVMTPGQNPIVALASAIAPHVEFPRDEVERRLRVDPAPVLAQLRAGHRGGCTAHVLFVDGLDQLVAGADPGETRQLATILGRLAEPASALRVLATVRAENLLAVAQLPGLAAAIGPAIYLLLEPRDETALREIITEPARLSGRAIGDPIVSALVASAAKGDLRLADLEVRLAALWDGMPPTVAPRA